MLSTPNKISDGILDNFATWVQMCRLQKSIYFFIAASSPAPKLSNLAWHRDSFCLLVWLVGTTRAKVHARLINNRHNGTHWDLRRRYGERKMARWWLLTKLYQSTIATLLQNNLSAQNNTLLTRPDVISRRVEHFIGCFGLHVPISCSFRMRKSYDASPDT